MPYHHDPPWVTLRSRSGTFVLKFFGESFISLYLLNMVMDQVDTLHDGRCCSEVLCCTVMTHLDDLMFNVMDLEILYLSFG